MRARTLVPLAAALVAVAAGALLLRDLPRRAAETPEGLSEILYGEREGASPGRWRATRTLTPEQQARIEDLESIGYLGAVRAGPGGSGVVRHDPGRAWPGLNFLVSGDAPVARLLDMDGRELHRWRLAFRDVWPDSPVSDEHVGTQYWRRARLCPNGDVVAIFEGLGILRVDRDSKLLWASPNHAHHDFALLPEGDLLALTREAHLVPRIDPEDPIVEDFLVRIDPQGREVSRLSLLEALERSEYERIWYARRFAGGDLFHPNAVFVLDDRLADALPAFRSGRVLTSFRYLDALAVVDPVEERVVWARGGPFRAQHDPRVLDNGHLLVFDNGFPTRGSSVLELDPVTFDVVWEYRGTPGEPFYTETCGTARRLPNGNTLICESDNGRAFEVTREGTIVWEYVNPARAGEAGELIATIPDLIRIPSAFVAEWLPDALPAGTGQGGERVPVDSGGVPEDPDVVR